MNLVHVAVVRNTKTVAVETNSINDFRNFGKTQNMHNSAFRYKLDTSGKNCKVLKNKAKRYFEQKLRGKYLKIDPL